MADFMKSMEAKGKSLEPKKRRRSFSTTNFRAIKTQEEETATKEVEAPIIAKTSPAKEMEGDVVEISINQIDAYKNQSRKHFDDESLIELARSIRNHGLSNPIKVVREGDRYQVVSGERRLRACSIAGLQTIKSFVIPKNKGLIGSVIDNLHREDLHILEEAMDYQKLLDHNFYKDATEVSEGLGVSRTVVSEKLGFLKAMGKEKAMDFIRKGELNSRQELRSYIKALKSGEPQVNKSKSKVLFKVSEKGGELSFKTNQDVDLTPAMKKRIKENFSRFIDRL